MNCKKARDIDLSEPIAIIGMGGIFPGAPDVPAFWRNILEKKDSIVEVPPDRWDWKLYYDPDPSVPDKCCSKIGGFAPLFSFDHQALGIPAPAAEQMDGAQKMALATAWQALRDSGYDRKPFDRARTAVILGNSSAGLNRERSTLRVYVPFLERRLSGGPAFAGLPEPMRRSILSEFKAGVMASLPPITADSALGSINSLITGRAASALDCNGVNFMVDASCAAALSALDCAVKGLRLQEYDMVLSGAVHRSMSPHSYVIYSKLGLLSPDGSRPFDSAANGIVMGEGAGVCVLKRLRTALKDGDRIYALIRAVGSSSDGRNRSVTVPLPRGQFLAIERAFEQLDYGPGEVGLLEAHGTSTVIGDFVEMKVLADIFGPHAVRRSIGLGSVKSQIGHLSAAAGAAGLMKTVLALHHKTLPPTINVRTPNPNVDWKDSPFFLVTEPRQWAGSGKARRAHVSAFAFGGVNYHVAIEEAP